MRKLKINRYKQLPGHCAVASCAAVANYYNKNITYESTQDVAKENVVKNLDNGLDSGEIGLLLNNLGFQTIFHESYSDDMIIVFQ